RRRSDSEHFVPCAKRAPPGSLASRPDNDSSKSPSTSVSGSVTSSASNRKKSSRKKSLKRSRQPSPSSRRRSCAVLYARKCASTSNSPTNNDNSRGSFAASATKLNPPLHHERFQKRVLRTGLQTRPLHRVR